MSPEKYVRKSFDVDAVRVTEENMEDVAKWCDGDIREEGNNLDNQIGARYVKVRVHSPQSDRQTKAYVGDWVLYSGKGYKVYTDKAFTRSFGKPGERGRNVFDDTVVDEVVDGVSANSNPGGTTSV